MSNEVDRRDLPATLSTAVDTVIGSLSDDDKARITAKEEDDLAQLHFSLGLWIRNNLSLWHGNVALADATGSRNPDRAPNAVLRQVWRRLRALPGE
jgi:uncharacterized protein DUF6794